jgi:hypothetical protein
VKSEDTNQHCTRLIAALRTRIARTGSTYFSCIYRSPVAVRTSQLPELCHLSSSVNCQHMQRAPCCEMCCRSCHFWVKVRFPCGHVLLLLIANQPICNFCILTTCKISREWPVTPTTSSSLRLPVVELPTAYHTQLPLTNEVTKPVLYCYSWAHGIPFFCGLYNDQRIWCLAKVIPWI